jgi:hypothetical protein
MPRATRIHFAAITTDVHGLRNLKKNLMGILRDTTRDFEDQFKTVTDKFTHENSPVWRKSYGFGKPPDEGVGTGAGKIKIRGFAMSGRPVGKALYGMASTENDKIFYYLEAGTDRRYRVMSPDWKSMTRPRMGTRTYARRGFAMHFDFNPTTAAERAIKPRFFAADVIKRQGPRFLTKVIKEFHGNAILNFFGETRVSK